MAGLGDLVVNLSANTQKFDKNISKSQTGLKSFGTAALSALNPVTAAFTAMAAGAVGLGAAVWGITSRFGDLAAVTDKAVQTGLSGAFLQQLTYAADMSGVSAETLTGGIKKLTIMIGQAAKGSKSAAEGLSDIGLSAKDLSALSPEQQFQKVVEGISRIPSAAGKAAAAVKIFGKSGIEMTGLFAGGLDDITKLMEDAREIGIGLDDEQLARVAEADDALQKMYAAIGAMVDQVAVGLAPAFEKVAENVTGLIGPVTKLFDTFNNMDERWKWLGDTMVASFDVAIETIKIHWKDMLKDIKDEAIGTVNFIEDMTNPVGMAGQLVGGLMGNGEPAPNPNAGLDAAQARLDGLLGQFEGAADENKPVENKAVPKRFEGDTPAINHLNEVFAEWDRLAAERREALDKYVNATDDQILAAGEAYRKSQEALMHHADVVVPAAGKAVEQERFNSGISSMLDKVKESASGGLLSGIGMAAEGMIDRAKIQAGAMGGMLEGWFGSFEKQKPVERELKPQLAGAMAAGSVEAYSTLVQAMMARGKDPVVAATEKQTKELIKGLKPQRATKNIMSFLGID